MYVNTEKLNNLLEIIMPNTTREARIKQVFKKLKIRDIPLNRVRYLSNEIINVSTPTGEELFKYLTDIVIQNNNINIKVYDIIFTTNQTGKPVFIRSKAEQKLKEIKASDNQESKIHEKTNTVNKESHDNLPSNNINEKINDNLQNEFYQSMIQHLKEMNENLEIISKTQTETCNFIKTLIFALNGNSKNAA